MDNGVREALENFFSILQVSPGTIKLNELHRMCLMPLLNDILGGKLYEYVTDDEAAEAFFLLSRLEGIIPAIESSHALAYAIKCARNLKSGSILVNLSGRGDKDMDFMLEKYPDMFL